ncbi:MAG: peptidoglycan endopeptidase [Verrucomicrobia bacterium]|nr:peptidoglycan endopeptidase [Deltaproteobacteria bacterium]
MKKLVTLILWCTCCHAIAADAASYGVVRSAAPVLNTPMFSSIFGGADGKTLKTDRCGQVRELEFIALPGTVFSIRAEIRDGVTTVLRVETEDYPMPDGTALYVDSRLVELREEKPAPRTRQLPALAEIVATLKASLGSPYVWGGNVAGGVSELISLFYGGSVSVAGKSHLTLAGLDCSGLLYQTTGGWTPRNTSQLVSYGRAVQIAGKTAEAIAMLVESLDLIVWNGHVIIVLDRDTVIESRLECGRPGSGGVVMTPLRQRLAEILRKRRPVDAWPSGRKQRDVFVVRRWFSQ